MSDEQLGKPISNAENITQSPSDGKSSSHVSSSNLAPRILTEHNYNAVPSKALPAKRTLRQLVWSMHAKTSPKEFKELPEAVVSHHISLAAALKRRLRRLCAGGRRFICFEPMTPLQEAIAQKLAKEMGCQTSFYKAQNASRYLVAYRPGIDPKMSVIRDEVQEPMSFLDNKLRWHQPVMPKNSQKATKSTQNSLSLGIKILEEFKRDYISNKNVDEQNQEP